MVYEACLFPLIKRFIKMFIKKKCHKVHSKKSLKTVQIIVKKYIEKKPPKFTHFLSKDIKKNVSKNTQKCGEIK